MFMKFLSAVCKINFREWSPLSPDSTNIQKMKGAIKPEEFWKAVSKTLLAEIKKSHYSQTFFFFPFFSALFFQHTQSTHVVSWSVSLYMPPAQLLALSAWGHRFLWMQAAAICCGLFLCVVFFFRLLGSVFKSGCVLFSATPCSTFTLTWELLSATTVDCCRATERLHWSSLELNAFLSGILTVVVKEEESVTY